MGGHRAHDASFCLLHGGEIAVAIQEERLLGRKHANLASPQPEGSQAFWYCLDYAGLQPGDLDLLCGGIGNIPGVPLLSFPHHLQHAMSAFALSGMDEAAVLVVDGMGDNFGSARERDSCVNLKFARKPDSPPVSKAPWSYNEIISIYRFNRHSHETLEKHYGDSSSASLERMQQFPVGLPLVQSLGSMYQWVSRGILLGGVVSRDILRGAAHARLLGALDLPGKLMGLASYGEPRIPHEAFFSISGSGEFCFDGEVLERCLEGEPWPARRRECENFAASVQAALEEALLYLAQRARQLSGCSHLCYAGGLALNSVANERIVRESGFAEVFIPPPANDAGLALGAAFLGLRSLVGNPSPSPPPPPPQNQERKVTRFSPRRLRVDSFGRNYTAEEIELAIAKTPCVVAERIASAPTVAATALAEGSILGWFTGGSEFGPRALGQRSILCDPRRSDGKDVLNSRVKFREEFRPFAPAVLQSEVRHWFEIPSDFDESPFMLRVLHFRDGMGARVPAVAHIDNTGRVQTVGSQNGRFFELLRAFESHTGVPILLNTSFNVMGGPIVEAPADALWCLLYTDLDAVVMEDYLVRKAPGFHSVLELRPQFAALDAEFIAPVSMLPESSAREILRIRTPSPLAAAQRPAVETRLLPGDVGPDPKWVVRLDGRRTGFEILAELQEQDAAWDERRLARALNRLHLSKALHLAV